MGSSVAFDRRTLVLPDGSHFLEHIIETQGDVVIGDHARIEYGLSTTASMFLGDGVQVVGDITAGNDVRIDLFSTIEGEVRAEGSAYLGEGVRVTGRLSVARDLDVGDDVTLEEGFEARGWINIRNPIPLVVYLFIYLMQLLRQGNSEEVERILAELEDAEETFTISDTFCFVPAGSRLGLEQSVVKGAMRTGADCRVLGNFQVDGFATLGRATELHGSLRAKGNVRLEPGVVVHGDLESWGELEIGDDAVVHGQVRAQKVSLLPGAEVRGTIVAPEGVQFLTTASVEMEQKVKDFSDGVQEIQDMLE